MTTALTLLITAFQLLTMVANTPNLSQEFKDNAINIANQAVKVAQDEIAKANQVTTEPVTIPPQIYVQPITTQPITNLGTTQNMEDIVITQTNTPKPDLLGGQPYGEYNFRVGVLDTNGKHIKFADISFTSQDNVYPDNTRKTDSQTGVDTNDWTGSFVYVPKTTGVKTLTFTSGNLTKTLNITVE